MTSGGFCGDIKGRQIGAGIDQISACLGERDRSCGGIDGIVDAVINAVAVICPIWVIDGVNGGDHITGSGGIFYKHRWRCHG